MRHLHRLGFPFSSNFIVEMAMVGRRLPTVGLIALYSSSVIVVHAGRFVRPLYSSSYAVFQRSLSVSLRVCIWSNVGTSRLERVAADTWRAMDSVKMDD